MKNREVIENLKVGLSDNTTDANLLLKNISQIFDKDEVAFTTSLGEEDQVITDMIFKNDYPFEVATLDTGRLFKESYELIETTELFYKKKIKVYFPNAIEVEEFVNEKGINSFYDSVENRKECCRIRKVEPLKRVLKDKKLWITGLRRDQSHERNSVDVVSWDSGFGLYKINPLYNWHLQDVRAYNKERKVPVNPLHNKGFVSIGCCPCTKAISPEDDIRLGRWWWESETKKECGLHIKNKNK